MALKALQGLAGVLVVAMIGCGSQQPEGGAPSVGIAKQRLTTGWNYTGSLSSGPPSEGRIWHTATVLPSGKVLVIGGLDPSTSNEQGNAWLYDPGMGTWSAAGTMIDARDSHTATLLSSGKVVVTGGYSASSGVTNSVEIYDPVMNSWAAASPMTYARIGHSAVEVVISTTPTVQRRLLVMGGDDSSNSEQPYAELYDEANDSWTPATDMLTARAFFGAVVLSSGHVLVEGGTSFFNVIDDTEEYDPVMDSWSPGGHLMTGRTGHTATLLSSGKVLVTGGYSSSGGLSDAEVYDPAALMPSWGSAGSMPYNTAYTNLGRVNHAAVRLSTNEVLVAGGNGNAVNKSTVLYDPTTNSWSSSVDMNDARENHTLSLLSSGNVLVVGGNYAPESAEEYTP